MAGAYDFTLNEARTTALYSIGAEKEPLLMIDTMMHDPAALVRYAATEVVFTDDGATLGYPGVRAAAPLNYVEAVARALDPLIRRAFALQAVVLARADCTFSIVTRAPADLHPLQRIPHVDTDYPLQFAVLHYLCDGNFGGTGFYRHTATGFETISAARNSSYIAARDAQLAARAPPPGYIGSNPQHFIQTAAIAAHMDRLIVYRSCLLHCGLIPPDMPRIADPRAGRLTANIFVTYRADTAA